MHPQKRSERFPKSYRLLKRTEFVRTQTEGKKFRSRFFLLSLTPSPGTPARLGVTVTTKVHKRAVHRNRLKRRIRELFRTNHLKLQQELQGVVIALNGSTELSFEEIQRELCFLVRKAQLFQRGPRRERE